MPEDNTTETEVIPHQETSVTTTGIFYSAPLPPASEFERYERVLKGSADRIIKLAENQNAHRRFIENVVVIFDSKKLVPSVTQVRFPFGNTHEAHGFLRPTPHLKQVYCFGISL